MKLASIIPALLFCLFLPLQASAVPCPGLSGQRERPGNDDLFIFVDSSMSMGPVSFGRYAHGYMEPVKQVLTQLTDCYLKTGDFVLIGTFDAEARLEVAKEIRVPERDLATLREEISALGPSRPRYWDRQAPANRGLERDRGEYPLQIVGGSLRTDLGEMLDLARRTIEQYSSPSHRQLILLFTDGEHDPPEYSRYKKAEIRLEDFFPQLGAARHKLGLVILPDSSGAVDKDRLVQLINSWDPHNERREEGSFTPIQPDLQDPKRTLFDPIIEMLKWRIDLVEPGDVDLEDQFRPRIEQQAKIHNGTKIVRTVKLKGAYFESNSGERAALELSPLELVLQPGETASLSISGDLKDLPRGRYEGFLRFEPDSAVMFDPLKVPVHGRKLSFLEAYGWALGFSASLVLAGVLLAVYLLRKRVWMVLLWTNGRRTEVSTVKPIGVGQTLKFGASGTGGLEVEGPDSRLGEVVRKTIEDFELAFDYRYLSGQSSGAEGKAVRLAMGLWYDIPGSKDERVSFRRAYTRKRATSLARALRTGFGGEGPGSGLDIAASSATGSLGF